MSKMLIFALHVKTDRKLTVVNKITRNSFLQSPKRYRLLNFKRKNSNIDKRITKQTTLSAFLPNHHIISKGVQIDALAV